MEPTGAAKSAGRRFAPLLIAVCAFIVAGLVLRQPADSTSDRPDRAIHASGSVWSGRAVPAPRLDGTPRRAGLAAVLYAADSFWNVPIASNAALDPGSSAMVQAALVAFKGSANFANTDGWGIAIVRASPTDPLYDIECTRYDCGKTVSVRIPVGAKPSTQSDRHLVVVDGNKEVDMWLAAYNSATHTWSAGSRYATTSDGWGAMCALGSHCNGGVAAGFAAFGGVARPEDFAGTVIPHALAITTPFTRSDYFACPAAHTDGKDHSVRAIPLGARVQLDPGFNVEAQRWPEWKKVIARTLQVYGAYIVDTGGSLAIRGEADLNRNGSWQAAHVPEGGGLSDLPWGKFRVLQMTQC